MFACSGQVFGYYLMDPDIDHSYIKADGTSGSLLSINFTVGMTGEPVAGVTAIFRESAAGSLSSYMRTSDSNGHVETTFTSSTTPEVASVSANCLKSYSAGDPPQTCLWRGSAYWDIYVVKAEIKSIKFTNDHGVLKDNNSDWTDNYNAVDYSTPEWVKNSTNRSITKTKNTSLNIDVVLKVEPSDVAYDLIGDCSDNYLSFAGIGNTSTGEDQTISSITALAALPDYITTINKSVDWKIRCTSADPDIDITSDTSGPHKIYVTFGAPWGSVQTEKRVAWVCNYADGATNNNAASLIQSKLHNDDPPYFQGGTGALPCSPIWLMMNETPNSIPGDCIAHANLMRYAMQLMCTSASYAYVADASNQPSTSSPILKIYKNDNYPGVNFVKWFQEESGGAVWNFEGVCCVNNLYYDVAWSTTSGTYEYCITQGNGIVYRWWFMYEENPGDWEASPDQNPDNYYE